MQFNNSTDESGLVQEIDRICGSTSNTYSLKAKTTRLNQALSRFISLAIQYDGEWQFDDSNWTSQSIENADLVSGQQDYTLDTDVLMIVKVLAKDISGYWRELSPVNTNSQESKNLWELPPGNSGSPMYYDLLGTQILLDPIPSYNSTNGLKVVFKRAGYEFASTDTTLEPGIPSLFHPYLARYASLPFLVEHNLPQARSVATLIEKDEQDIKDFFGMRDMHKRSELTPKWRSSR